MKFSQPTLKNYKGPPGSHHGAKHSLLSKILGGPPAEITKFGPKTQENEKNEVLKMKFSQPTLKNY